MSARMGPEQGREVGVCRRKHTERDFYKLTRMLLLGQVEPADSLTFRQQFFFAVTATLSLIRCLGRIGTQRAGFKTFCLDRRLARCINSYCLFSQCLPEKVHLELCRRDISAEALRTQLS